MSNEWINEQIEKIQSLKGQTINRFIAQEMAFRGGEDGNPPEFSVSELPFLQVTCLYLELSTGQIQKFITYQTDDTWGLFLDSELKPNEPEPDLGSVDSIFRTRELLELPSGHVNSVNVVCDSYGQISEVTIDFDGNEVFLLAGEVQEQNDGSLDVIPGDESIFIFRNPEDRNKVKFRSCGDNRQYTEREIRWVRYFSSALIVIGFWFVIHGGLSLLGGFGFERHMHERYYDREPITESRMWTELFVGGAVMAAGCALRIKSTRTQLI